MKALSPERLWRRVGGHFFGREGSLFHLFRAWFERIPSRISFLSSFFFLRFLYRDVTVQPGQTVFDPLSRCVESHPSVLSGSVGSKTSSVSIAIASLFRRRNFILRSWRRNRFRSNNFKKESSFIGRFISHFIVGFGYLWRGNFFRGLLLTFLFFVFVMRFVYWNGVITLSWVRLLSILLEWVLWGGLFVLLYLICLRQIYRLKPKFESYRRKAGERGEC